jgi:hypothetical protein
MFGMRRTVLAVVLLAAATASAINTDSHPIRIALLAAPDQWVDRRDEQTADLVRNHLRGELRELGYDAFLTGDRVTDLGDQDTAQADYYLDVTGAASGYPVGAVGFPIGRHAGAEIGVMVSRVAASVNVYDGRSLDLIRTIDLQKRKTSVAPTAVGLGGRWLWAAIALPIVEWSQYRAGVRAVAHDAALQLDEALRR